ncbi:MAG: hypothetical protein PHT88_00030 [Candidatus Moranbacteria bacterium]|nr:hypothetical protein [Candidatus Moranbacteria bacterium]
MFVTPSRLYGEESENPLDVFDFDGAIVLATADGYVSMSEDIFNLTIQTEQDPLKTFHMMIQRESEPSSEALC